MRFMVQSTALYAPPRVETADEVAKQVGTSVEWIRTRTGVERRHICEEPIEIFAARAAREALAGETPDLLIYASASPRQLIPDTSVFVARELGLANLACHSIHATCLSFLVALHSAGAFLTSGAYRKILIVSAEIASLGRRMSQPESASILGDGAAAALVVATPPDQNSCLLAWQFRTYPEAADLVEFAGGGTRHHPNAASTVRSHNEFSMNGPALYWFTVPRAKEVIEQVIADAGLTMDDIRVVVPHQASGPGINALSSCGVPSEKVVNVVGEYGNCVAASIPMALAIAHREGRLKRGEPVLIVGTGAGLSIGAAVIRW